MHSTDYLKEVNDKLDELQKTLSLCESEKLLLKNNLNSVKEAVADSFKRHIGTLQCRAKWLVCHADSIFHLKQGCLIQQIAELEHACDELKSVLEEASGCHEGKSEELQAMNVFKNFPSSSLQPCENGSMSFVGDDGKMEEMIVSYGDIEVHTDQCLDDLSDEGIFVVESPLKNSDAMETEEKPVLPHVDSGNSESDFERVELQPPDDDFTSRRQSQNDSAYEESGESDEWLSPSCRNAESKKTSSNISNSADKVPRWLINCDDMCDLWIRPSHSSNDAQGSEISATESIWLKEAKFKSNRSNSMPVSLPENNYFQRTQSTEEVSKPINKLDHILRSPDSMYLRGSEEASSNDAIKNLNNILNSFMLSDKDATLDFDVHEDYSMNMDSSIFTNVDRLNLILEAPHSHFLKGMNCEEALSETHIKYTNAVSHLSMLGNQPDRMFLYQPAPQTIDPEICEWLRGESTDMCAQCPDVCGYGSRFDDKWLFTATDW